MSRDIRKYAQSTNFRLVVGALILLFTVGVGLIYLIYGQAASITALICLGAFAIPIILIVIVLWIMDKVVKHARPE